MFEAVGASDTNRLVTRQPLQPKNSQLRTSSHEPVDTKQSFDGAADENRAPSPNMLYHPIHQSRAMHGQALHPDTPSNIHPLSPSLGRASEASHSKSNTSGSTFRSSTLPHSPVKSRMTPYSGAPTPLSTSDRTEGTVSPGHGVPGIKSEQTMETKLHEMAPMVEPSLSAAEIEEQKQKSFQLQTLLKDAGPKMLETSVEQGVKLLDHLKAPLLNKMQNSPDAEQWIQQIDNLIKQVRTIRSKFFPIW